VNNRKLRLVGALASLAALTAVSAGGTASADTAERGGVVTAKVKMKVTNQGKPVFAGPDTVVAGTGLKVINRTRGVGPHTFSLVERDALPQNKTQRKKCFNFKLICGDVLFDWHQIVFGPRGSYTVGVNPSTAGNEGWDTMGNRQQVGDSWFTDKKDQSFTQVVTAEPGAALRYFCAVHPNMKGKISVVPIEV
jgi:plastocyanin